jgi:anti-anti-sigma regulatory factor
MPAAGFERDAAPAQARDQKGSAKVERFVVGAHLDLDGRRSLVTEVTGAIETLAASGERDLVLECSHLETRVEPILGMLVMIGRSAQRHGMRVVLELPSLRLRQDIIRAGVRQFFIWDA